MSGIRVRSANDRRRDMRLEAGRLGIDETYISLLVESFYDRVRKDPELGPIFARAIPGDWGPHLAKMKDFWASVALGDTRYDGGRCRPTRSLPISGRRISRSGSSCFTRHCAKRRHRPRRWTSSWKRPGASPEAWSSPFRACRPY